MLCSRVDEEGTVYTLACSDVVVYNASTHLPCAGRRVTNHPHYESTALRAKTRRLYEFMGKYDDKHVHSVLRETSADYLVVDTTRCSRLGGEFECVE